MNSVVPGREKGKFHYKCFPSSSSKEIKLADEEYRRKVADGLVEEIDDDSSEQKMKETKRNREQRKIPHYWKKESDEDSDEDYKPQDEESEFSEDDETYNSQDEECEKIFEEEKENTDSDDSDSEEEIWKKNELIALLRLMKEELIPHSKDDWKTLAVLHNDLQSSKKNHEQENEERSASSLFKIFRQLCKEMYQLTSYETTDRIQKFMKYLAIHMYLFFVQKNNNNSVEKKKEVTRITRSSAKMKTHEFKDLDTNFKDNRQKIFRSLHEYLLNNDPFQKDEELPQQLPSILLPAKKKRKHDEDLGHTTRPGNAKKKNKKMPDQRLVEKEDHTTMIRMFDLYVKQREVNSLKKDLRKKKMELKKLESESA